jgi:3-methylcrotonyl-CoA carboxylase alpha subunit
VAHISIESNSCRLKIELLPDGRLRVGDAVFTSEDLGGGAWRIVSDGKAVCLWAAGPREHPWVYFDGIVYRPRLGAAPAGRQHRDDAASLSAPMPATVRAVLVSPGQTVVHGETMVILEAMKMELPLRAPHDGVIKDVRCQPGELVQPGVPLVEMQ